MGEIRDDDELALLNTKLFEQQKRTKELSDKIMQMKIKYRQLLEANTKSSLKNHIVHYYYVNIIVASKIRRGMAFEVDFLKFSLQAMEGEYHFLIANKIMKPRVFHTLN